MTSLPTSTSIGHRLVRLLRHRWADNALSHTLSPQVQERLTQRVSASEQHHTGQICICVERGLPFSYLWRNATARERAVSQFAKLRVWDTEHNNGVLIYLLHAEHAIEIVSDRGLSQRVPTETWTGIVEHLGHALLSQRYEEGLLQALDAVNALLVQHFPTGGSITPRRNELPDAPVMGL